MAKDAISEYSSTAAENTDLGGINILGSAPVSNLDDALRELMAQLADMNSGASPLDDTFKLQDPSNNNRQIGFDLTGLPATLNSLPMLALSRGGAPKVTAYTSNGTHTFASGSKRYQILAVAGGGGGRAVYSVSPAGVTRYAAGSGGQSGQFGMSDIKSISFSGSTALTAEVTIGAGGTCSVDDLGVATNVSGGNTSWVHGALTLALTGGSSTQSPVQGAATVEAYRPVTARSIVSGWLSLGQNLGELSVSGIAGGASGCGGSSPYGSGGVGLQVPGSSGALSGIDGIGYGSGGGGAVALSTSGQTIYGQGGAGAPGLLIVMEW